LVRAKFRVTGKSVAADLAASITMSTVIDGSEENKQFFAATPCGQITFGTVNPAAAEQFEVGKEYYVDFTEVELAADPETAS
jgi:hypothetical protein